MTLKLYEKFQNPSVEYRGKPFWSWNGKLDKEELLRQVHVMKEMGFGGYFMHSRTGLVTEYLGEEWFELINACADEGEKLGMEAWLYDEDRWPSGTAGGMVTEEPKYRLKFIYLQTMPASEFVWDENILAAFSCKLDGLDFYECSRIFGETPCEHYEGNTILKFTVVESGKSSFYNGYTYVDTMNREATNKFLELTHEKYKKYCGERLGKSIKGIFTDEPHRGALMDAFCVGNENGEWHAPWTYTLFEEFSEVFGYDLVNKLPELFLRPEGKAVSQVKWHYVELLQQLFLDNFAKPINEWCQKNNLILTGHVLHEDTLASQVAMQGSLMRFYEHMGYPGVDVLSEHNYNFWIAKQLQSAARQLGQKWLLSELYGCTGWQMDFESHKSVGDWQALFGINLRCHHLSWVTMEGEAKRDFPASILHQSTWWKEYKYVEDYFSRIGVVMSEGTPVCDVLVINPVESLWCQIRPKMSFYLGACDEEVQKIEENYRNIFHWLQGAQVDFDYGDEEMAGRLYKIEKVDGQAILHVGEAVYKLVVVGGMTTIRSSTLKVLKEFMEAGGKVVFAGQPPEYVDALESQEAVQISSKAICVPFDKASVVDICRKNISASIDITDSNTGENIPDIFCQLREDNGIKYILVMNINREKTFDNVKIRLCEQGYVEEWNCVSSERYLIAQSNKDGFIEILTSFPASGEHLYIITPSKPDNTAEKLEYEIIERRSIEGSFDYRLDEPNVCVLDMAEYKIDDGEWQPVKEILKADREIRRTLGLDLRGGEMIQPWYAKKGGYSVKCQLKLAFEFFVNNFETNSAELAIESPESFKIMINGSPIDSSAVNGWWIDKCFSKIPIPSGMIVEGRNVIELETGFHQGINLEALYLLGNFGVQLNGNKKTLVKLPEKLAFKDFSAQYLPFYTGKVTYKLDLGNQYSEDEKVFIELDGFDAACVKVFASEGEMKMIAWQPYEADITDLLAKSKVIDLEVVLTRRNTFGPLHQVPLYTPGYGPENFITEGPGFSEDYMLVPSGILNAPKVSVRKLKG